MTQRRLALAFGTAVAICALLAAGRADAAPSRLTPKLASEVAHARSVDATPFANVSDIVSRASMTHAAARGRRAPVAQTLARLGPAAALPILELLGDATPRAPQVRRDLIEALGLLADARALPVLGAILNDATEDADTTRTTAEAVARIGTNEAATQLLGALAASGSGSSDRTRAILAGAGECRRLRVTEAIAARLRGTSDEATVRAAARSLGRAGNAWAWRTLADRSEEAKIRETAARALVEAYARSDGEAREAAAKALLVVDAAITPALIAEARAALPSQAAAFDALARRFAENPSR